jgi:hypothetical protein
MEAGRGKTLLARSMNLVGRRRRKNLHGCELSMKKQQTWRIQGETLKNQHEAAVASPHQGLEAGYLEKR